MIINRSIPYAVELDGKFLVGRKDRLRHVDDLRSLKGDYYLFSDLQGAISRTMAVEADIRYAELMISRKLQEAGEFEEPVFIITHWKKKRGKHMTDICFTALPSKRYFQYLDKISQYDAHLLVMPLQSILWGLLRKRAGRQPAAVVFQHDRFADLIVGTRRRVWYAGRAVAFDNSDEQIASLWDTIRSDIRKVIDEYNQPIDTVYMLTWIDSSAMPRWSEEADSASHALNIVPLDAEQVVCDGQAFQVSLPKLIRSGKACPTLAPLREKMLHGARRLLPYLNMCFLLLAVLCVAAGIWYQRQGDGLQQQLEQMKARATEIRSQVPTRLEAVDYEATLKVVDQLWASRLLPTYNQVLQDFSSDGNAALQLKNIKADYRDSKVEVSAFGTVSEPFEVSYRAYQKMLHQLRRRGYRVVEERFDTRIRNSNFTLRLVKEVQ